MVQVGQPVDSLQTGWTQVVQGPGHPEEVGVWRSSRQRSKLIPYQAGTGGMEKQIGQPRVKRTELCPLSDILG